MYFNEEPHEGRPHFHAIYGDDEASFSIADASVLAGKLPPQAVHLVADWTSLHRYELLADWERARQGESLFPIAPLD